MNKGAYFTTASGRRVDLLRVSAADIIIEDIAHQLAQVNRFGGSLEEPVSVAQHCVYVSQVVEVWGGTRRECLQGLLHDASEAYLGDVTKWFKESYVFRAYRDLEDQLQRLILAKYDCEEVLCQAVLDADRLMCRVEGRLLAAQLGEHVPECWSVKYQPPSSKELELVGRWEPWLWRRARGAFLDRFEQITVVSTV